MVEETLPGALTAGMVSGKAVLDAGGDRAAVPLMGVEGSSYFDLFPGMILLDGQWLENNENGILITKDRADSIKTKTGQSVNVGQKVLLTAGGNSGFKIREVPIKGIFQYRNPGPFMGEVVISDAQTVRALSSVLAEATEDIELENEALELLDNDLSDLFGSEDSLFEEVDSASVVQDSLIDNLYVELARDDEVEKPWVGGDWNFIIVRLPEENSALLARSRLNNRLSSLGVHAVGWQTAAGNSALMVLLVQNLFYIGILLVCIAAIVTIVNIILISVFRRIREIGTLRAIGASDRYIMSMLGFEILVLSLFGGITGVFFGKGVMSYINGLEWPIPHPIIAALMGSPVLQVSFYFDLAIWAVFLSVIIGLISAIIPSIKAVKINPIEAVRQG